MSQPLPFFAEEGFVLRWGPLDDDAFAELSIEFANLPDPADQMLISIAALFMALREDRVINYVFSSYTLQRVVLRTADMSGDVEQGLVDTIRAIRDRMSLLDRFADEYFYVDGNGGPLRTGDDPALVPFRVTEGYGQAFVEAFSAELRKPLPPEWD